MGIGIIQQHLWGTRHIIHLERETRFQQSLALKMFSYFTKIVPMFPSFVSSPFFLVPPTIDLWTDAKKPRKERGLRKYVLSMCRIQCYWNFGKTNDWRYLTWILTILYFKLSLTKPSTLWKCNIGTFITVLTINNSYYGYCSHIFCFYLFFSWTVLLAWGFSLVQAPLILALVYTNLFSSYDKHAGCT